MFGAKNKRGNGVRADSGHGIFNMGSSTNGEELVSQRSDDDDKDDEMMDAIRIPSEQDGFDDAETEDALQIDRATQLPITKLPYAEGGPIPKSSPDWLKNGRHLELSIDKAHNFGILYVTRKLEGEEEEGKTDKLDKPETSKLYPFELEPKMDKSEERVSLLNKLYEDFEPLLKNRAYKTYSDDDDTGLEIGVLSIIRNRREEKKTFLRSVITNTIENLKEIISIQIRENDETTYVSMFNYEEILNVINLLNALKFAKEDEIIILLQMWVNRASLQPDNELVDRAMDNENGSPYKNLIFWSAYLKKLILRGYFDQAMSALDESGYEELEQSDVNLFNLITDLRTLMGTYDAVEFSRDSKSFFQWKKNVVELRERLSELEFVNKEISVEVREMISTMSGFGKTIQANCSSWYEYLLARFMFSLPSMKMINGYVEEAVAAFPVNQVSSWESICQELFECKYLNVISSLEMLDRSIATYMGVLMSAAGLLKPYSEVMGNDHESDIKTTIDQMLEDLTLSYFAERELFSTAVGILVTTGNSKAREIVSQMLPKYQIQDNDDFEWSLSVCAKLKLTQTAVDIYNIQGEVLLNQGYEYESLECFAEAGNAVKLVDTVWKIFENLLLDGEHEDSLLNEKIDANEIQSSILRQALSPLALLRDILKYDLKSSHSERLSFEKLIKLLQFKYLPAHCKPVLLLMLLPFFNTASLTLHQLVEIIKILNDYEKQLREEEHASKYSEQMYRMALKRKNIHKSGSEFDWRNRQELPVSCQALILKIRELISFEISFKFLEQN
ncbi:hypothetical protein FOA43_003128 [Brettanomyces nanus]|uniref:Nuclear pore complex protein Nup85 n=1 Tax=Eeniella nana TaxID=13502 RepID=A0A875S484_EENNA|nr:uncharacterized protein FOA43_003128 [Brettanomyces nanus]QPG75768.1 hypothetical protein FOA43_003128 [Brettanomyces nanus]